MFNAFCLHVFIYIQIYVHTMHYFGMGHIPKQICVWLIGFQICTYPGFLLQKIMINYHSSVEFVVNQPMHYLIINFQHQIPISICLVVFLLIRILVKAEWGVFDTYYNRNVVNCRSVGQLIIVVWLKYSKCKQNHKYILLIILIQIAPYLANTVMISIYPS